MYGVYFGRTVFDFVMSGHVVARILMHLDLVSINAYQFAVNTASLTARLEERKNKKFATPDVGLRVQVYEGGGW
jgi:hypothetical protein